MYNMWVIRKIVSIVWRRFGIKDIPYTDAWFVFVVRKWRKYWREAGYQVEKLVRQLNYVGGNGVAVGEDPNSEMPAQE